MTRSALLPRVRHAVILLVLLGLLGSACRSDTDNAENVDETGLVEQLADQQPESDGPERAPYDRSVDSDAECLEPDMALSSEFDYSVAHPVVDGILGAPCFGTEDDRLIEAWNILSDLTPPDQLRDLKTFAGYSQPDGDDPDSEQGVTLAFVQPGDIDPSLFIMAVNLPASTDSYDELTLTMAHEFTHVFTASPSELDRDLDPNECETYDNSEGCYVADSIMAGWYDAFWGDLGYRATGDTAADEADGVERCTLQPRFFGEYAASSPEEDFAETFSAYVLRVEPISDAQQDKLDWIDQFVGLQEFRQRAVAFGYEPIAYGFGECGGG